MPGPQTGDVLIRVQTNTTPTTYLLLEAGSNRSLGGPFSSMSEAAIAAAKHVGAMSSVWQEHLDQRGRPLGPPLRLPVTRT
jgi:hypothetical protein